MVIRRRERKVPIAIGRYKGIKVRCKHKIYIFKRAHKINKSIKSYSDISILINSKILKNYTVFAFPQPVFLNLFPLYLYFPSR